MRCINKLCQKEVEIQEDFCEECGFPVIRVRGFKLPDLIRENRLQYKLIPTVCNIKNMIKKLENYNGDYKKLKSWEKRSYTNYNIKDIKCEILDTDKEERIAIIRKHILKNGFKGFGANLFDIYFVAFVCENITRSKKEFIEYCMKKGLVGKPNSAGAIWQVGKGDGAYLEILNEDGTVQDWGFMYEWIKGLRGI